MTGAGSLHNQPAGDIRVCSREIWQHNLGMDIDRHF